MEVPHEQDQSHAFLRSSSAAYRLGLDTSRIDGHVAVLDEWERNHAAEDDRWLAYILATAQREAGAGRCSGQCRNGNEKSGDGWHYRGRGLVQIAGEANYTKFGCVQNPDMPLAPESAIRILFDGMINGGFTGKSLPIASAGPPLIGSAPGRLSIRAISAT
jgi:putative chitinase